MSSGASGRNQLNYAGRGVDVNWFGSSPRYVQEYQDWARTESFISEFFDFNVDNNSQYGHGQTASFFLDKRMDKMNKVHLIYTRAAITANGGTGSRYEDFEGYSSIDNVQWSYSSKVFFEMTGEEMYIWCMTMLDRNHRLAIAKQQNGFLSDSQRITAGASAFNVMVDLPVPWESLNRQIPFVALPNKIRVDVLFKPILEAVRQTTYSAAPTCAFSNAKLRVWGEHYQQPRRMEVFNQVMNGNGVSIKTVTREKHARLDLANVTTRQRWKLSNLKNATYNLRFIIRLVTAVANASFGALDKWSFLRPSRYWLEDSGQRITNIFECNDSTTNAPVDFGINYVNNQIHPDGEWQLAIMNIPLTDPKFIEASAVDCFMSRNFSKYNNLELVLEIDTAALPGAACYIDVWADIHNQLIYQRGDIRKYLL
jgi:hypothetical protein